MKEKILSGKTYLGIEFGSTRIKAVLTDDNYIALSQGGFSWGNSFSGGYWTYDIKEFTRGLKECFAALKKDVEEKYNVELTKVRAMGVSGMMHGYLAFDKDGNLLVPFRTWRNTTTEEASKELTKLFGFNVPQRWSVAHLYQAILNGEEHVKDIAHITTLAGYIHYLLTGNNVLGICEASGMFPITDGDYDSVMLDKFNRLIKEKGVELNIRDILPKVQMAGDTGSFLTEEGAKLLDENFSSGIPVCPPEGDAGTGMIATNSVLGNTGNISAGTSVFSMLVLEKPLLGYYEEVDVVMTPDGSPVAMIHSNNGCSELDGWVNVFGEFAELIGSKTDKSTLYEKLYKNALLGDSDCGGVVSYNNLAEEPVIKLEAGRPTYVRTPDSRLNLKNFMLSQIYATVAPIKIGTRILTDKENIKIGKITAHGGLFKVQGVAQQVLANALDATVSVMETASEGGAWGIALLAAYMDKNSGKSLGKWLDEDVFGQVKTYTLNPDKEGVIGYNEYIKRYEAGISGINVFKNIK